MSKDESISRISTQKPGSFRFDSAVARVFPDMLRRSIPGYESTIGAIESLARRYVIEGYPMLRPGLLAGRGDTRHARRHSRTGL